MKKKARKIVVCVMVVMSIFAVCSTAFAAGETLSHSGTSKTGYYTTNYLPQKNDHTIKCQNWYTSPSSAVMYAQPVYKVSSGGSWVHASEGGAKLAAYGTTFYVPTYSTVRHIHMHITNSGGSYGKSVYSSGTWQLLA